MNFPDANLPPILIVDDSQDDAFLLRYRLRLGGVTNPVITFEASIPALEYLHSAYEPNSRPELLFTDLKMPRGEDLISEIREDATWDPMKIVVVTYSNDPNDFRRARDLRVDGYLLKFPPPEYLAKYVHQGPWFPSTKRASITTGHAVYA